MNLYFERGFVDVNDEPRREYQAVTIDSNTGAIIDDGELIYPEFVPSFDERNSTEGIISIMKSMGWEYIS